MDKQRVVYRLPGMDQVPVRRDLPYKPDRNPDLLMDVYTPGNVARGERQPAVLFVHGEVPPDAVPHVKDWGQYVGWGQLAAASGLVGVTFNHRSTERYTTFDGVTEDIDDLLAHVRTNADDLGVDADRLAIWTCSAGAYLGLRAALRDAPMHIRCVVAYYGIMDIAHYLREENAEMARSIPSYLSPIHHLGHPSQPAPPMLLVRAGRDRPQLNSTLDWFVAEALRRNLDIECVNYPEGRHGFDVQDDTETSRRIIQRTLEFLGYHLKAK